MQNVHPKLNKYDYLYDSSKTKFLSYQIIYQKNIRRPLLSVRPSWSHYYLCFQIRWDNNHFLQLLEIYIQAIIILAATIVVAPFPFNHFSKDYNLFY